MWVDSFKAISAEISVMVKIGVMGQDGFKFRVRASVRVRSRVVMLAIALIQPADSFEISKKFLSY